MAEYKKTFWKILLCLLCNLANISFSQEDKNIYILWCYANQNALTDQSPMGQASAELKQFGYKFTQIQSLNHLADPALIVVYDVHPDQVQYFKKYPRNKLALMLWEPASVKPFNFDLPHHRYFSRIYTWRDDFVDKVNYFKIYYPGLTGTTLTSIDFDQKKLCTLVSGNKQSQHSDELYSKRLEAIEFFEKFHPDDFDFYGYGWTSNNHKTYKGTVGDKIACLKNYKFCICYENIKDASGYITEKIFDCFQAGCVPIYWGAPNVETYIPKNCFIACTDFKSYEALYQFMKNMSEETYLVYLENIKSFLASDQAQVYTPRYFIDSFKKMILEMTQPPTGITQLLPDPEFKNFVIVIPSHNNASFYKQNLDSVFAQTYQNYRIIYLDDASSDNTGKLVEDYVKEKQQEHRVTLIKNENRIGALANTYNASNLSSSHEIMVILDGDDWLHDRNVLSYLNEVYKNSDVWLTYGQFIYFPSQNFGVARPVPANVIESNGFREYRWVTNALRTFYAALFHKINKEDLLWNGTEFFQFAADCAYMFPMLEMASKHIKFIGKILYDYNRVGAMHDDKINKRLQDSMIELIRSKKKYKPLDNLFEKNDRKKDEL